MQGWGRPAKEPNAKPSYGKRRSGGSKSHEASKVERTTRSFGLLLALGMDYTHWISLGTPCYAFPKVTEQFIYVMAIYAIRAFRLPYQFLLWSCIYAVALVASPIGVVSILTT